MDKAIKAELLKMHEPRGFLTTESLTADQVEARARPMAKNIFKNREVLKIIVERHEPTIKKRWEKKATPKRTALLLQAWPNMPRSHRPDIAAWKQETKPSTRSKGRDTTPFMWPYINIEDLCKTEPLLLMLNSRARHAPDSFSAADISPTRFGIVCRMITPAMVSGGIMMFRGRKTPETYGQIYSRGSKEYQLECVLSERAHTLGEGLWILEIQDRLYSFLVNCCRKILHDIPEKSLLDSSLPSLPEPPLISAKIGSEGIESLAIASFEASYKLPADIDLDRLEAVVKAKLADSEDHLWSLREDPGYFANVLKEAKEHQPEDEPARHSQTHPGSKADLFWERVIHDALASALNEVDMWDGIYNKVVNLQKIARKYAGNISPEADLPLDLAMAFYELYAHLGHYQQDILDNGNLIRVLSASPPMRSHNVRGVPAPGDAGKLRAMLTIPEAPHTDAKSMLLWLFSSLSTFLKRFLFSPKTLLTELELLIRKDPSAKRLITGWVAKKIATFAIICECLHQISLYQPWAAGFKHDMILHRTALFQDIESSKKHTDVRSARAKDIWPIVAPHGRLTDGRFRYPASKRRTRENVEAMRRAEANLDHFWEPLLVSLTSIDGMSPRIQTLFKRELQRTGPWVEPAKLPKEDKAETVLVAPFGDLKLQNTAKVKVDSAVEKVKKKTRGQANPAPAPVGETENVPNEESQPARFKVDKSALKVFEALFFTPSASAHPGEVPWAAFLHAMMCVGFSAEKLYGSVWHFRPTKLDADRSIQFHEPHPSNKIPFTVARGYGRRLNRAYGWDGNMFELSS
ncbi:hypothetical protein F4779DRAFT_634663 [Xylariaceae sp. FL0662B]|nr:hypothetical protein F4779DRAFT_634663 [Xylariaceae sp. FL0662B]